MPALRVLGRRWHIATDDMPGIASAGVIFHISGIILYAIAVGGIEQTAHTDDCDQLFKKYQAFYALLLGLSVLQTVVESFLWWKSSRGEACMDLLTSMMCCVNAFVFPNSVE